MKTYKTILDVRTVVEFENDGAVANSVNIPLQEIQDNLEEIQNLPQPIVVCCLSGGRSGVASDFLQELGVDCFNGGGWQAVESAIESGELALEA